MNQKEQKAAVVCYQVLDNIRDCKDNEVRHITADEAVLNFLKVVAPDVASVYDEITTKSYYS
jgi:hypothetical protein